MVLSGAIAIGFAPIGLRLSSFGPQATAFWRFAFALPIIVAAIHALGGRIARPTRLSLIAGVFFGLDIAFWHSSLGHTSVANATFLVNLGNVAVGLVAWLALGERPAQLWPLALLVALIGAGFLSGGAPSPSLEQLQGDLMALAAAAMVGLYLFFAKLARRSETALNVLFWTTLTSLAVAACAAGIRHERLIPPDVHWLVTPLLLAAIAQVAGQGLIVAGVGRTPAAAAGLLLLVQPVASGLIAWPLFGERLAPAQLAGAALILFGVWLASLPRR